MGRLGYWAGQSTTCPTEGHGDNRGPLSDHCPACVAWEPTARPIGFPRRVPEWVYRESSWAAILADAWAKLDTEGMSEWEALG